MEVKSSATNKALLITAAIVVILAGIKAAKVIVVPFLLSIFIAIICSPLSHWCHKRLKIPQSLAVIFVVLVILVSGIALAGLVGNSLNSFTQSVPLYKAKLEQEFVWVLDTLRGFNIEVNRDLIMQHFDPGVAMNMATNLLAGLGGVMANLFLIILTVVFMLLEASSIPKKVHVALHDPDMKLQHIDKFIAGVNNYLAIKTMVSLGTGVLVAILLGVIGVEHVILWSVLAFLLNYIPNIGSIIAAVPPLLLALVEVGVGGSVAVAGGFVAINMVMGNVVEPRFMGKGLGLSTLVVFLSLIFWGWLLGTVGMLLSVPLTMIVKIALEASTNGKWLALLLSSEEDFAAKV